MNFEREDVNELRIDKGLGNIIYRKILDGVAFSGGITCHI